MKKVLLVEDDLFIRQELKILLESLGFNVSGEAETVTEAISSFKMNRPDIAILDVRLKNNDSGLDVAHFFKDNNFNAFLFLSSYADDHTITKAAHLSPLAYLVKPFKDEDVKSNVTMAYYKSIQQPAGAMNEELRTLLKVGSGYHATDLDKLIFIKGDNNYSELHFKDRKHVISNTLKKMESALPKSIFIRVSKDYIVNIKKVSSIRGNLVYIDEQPFPLGNAYKKSFLEMFDLIK